MGTTLANLHILGGDEQLLCTVLPKETVGQWSARFVSAYFPEFEPRLNEKTARALSKKLAQPVLLAWIFDSDAVGLVVYQSGKTVAEHIFNPDGYSKMGNIALFCESLGLPAEDVPRLRAVWKKGNAEEQLALTELLLGLPLYHNAEVLPDRQHSRDSEAVDKWIAERPAPPKIKNETKAELVQELTHFRWNYIVGGSQCCSIEPYDDEYSFNSCQFWIPNADGTLRPDWSTKEYLRFHASQDRIIGVDDIGVIAFDSAGLLPKGYRTKNYLWCFLPDGGLLWQENVDLGNSVTFTRCACDGSEMWQKRVKDPGYHFFSCENSEIIFTSESAETYWLERIDGLTGATIEKMPKPFGLNTWSKAYHNGSWWIAHDGNTLKDGKRESRGNTLTKLDGTFQPLAELALPIYSQKLFFSPDNAHVYVFFFQDQVMVLNAETLAVENVLIDKSCLIPCGFDSAGRFWLRRDHSTVEAWDALLCRPLSRHKLKGEIMGHHQNEQGDMCIVAWRKKDRVLRVYKLA